jgi:tetratricopeptide (TPR) repeat protein
VDRLGALILLLCLSCLMAPFGAIAQRPVTVAGNVYCEENPHAAKNVQVYLSDAEQVQIAAAATGESGEFRFDGLKRGTYTVNVDAPGYEPVSVKVDLSILSDKGITIYLKRISKDQESPKSSSISAHELSMPAKARDLMESGKKKLYQDKNSAAGLADFQQAILVAPKYYEAHYQLAIAYLTQGNGAEAEKSLRRSVELSGDKYGEADVRLGAIFLDRGNFPEGEKTIRRGIQLSPNFWLGHYELGRALFDERRVPEAQVSAERARVLAPGAAIVYRLLANIHLQEKNYAALLQDIDEYLRLDPDSPAGIRAKEIRAQVQQKMATDNPTAAAKP